MLLHTLYRHMSWAFIKSIRFVFSFLCTKQTNYARNKSKTSILNKIESNKSKNSSQLFLFFVLCLFQTIYTFCIINFSIEPNITNKLFWSCKKIKIKIKVNKKLEEYPSSERDEDFWYLLFFSLKSRIKLKGTQL